MKEDLQNVLERLKTAEQIISRNEKRLAKIGVCESVSKIIENNISKYLAKKHFHEIKVCICVAGLATLYKPDYIHYSYDHNVKKS